MGRHGSQAVMRFPSCPNAGPTMNNWALPEDEPDGPVYPLFARHDGR
jgi:hypothetical protein